MSYEYYRNSMPGWGTSQFQFGSPPAPMFQPQPSWGGLDFYNAHAINPDPTFYNSIMARAPSFGSFPLGRDDARYWHRRIYSGLVPLAQVLPNDVGAAAAYEAYRTWKHNPFLHEPLSADRVQQREGLVGMAIAEATRLWQYAGRSVDTLGLRAAAEAAAAVASVLADRLLGYMSAGGMGSMGGMGMGMGMPGAPSYASSGGSYAGIGAGYRGRRSSISTPFGAPGGGSPFVGGGSPYLSPGAGMGMGMGAYSPNVSPALGPAGGMGGSPYGGMPRSISPLPGAGLGAGAGAGMGMGMGGMPGVGGVHGAGMSLPGAGAGMGMGGGAGMGMGMGGYPNMNTSMQSAPPGSTIIVKHGGRRRRHSDAGRHRRSSSVEVIQTGGRAPYGGGYGGYGGGGGGYAGSYGGGYGGGVGGYGAGMGSQGGGMGGYGGGMGGYSGGMGGYSGGMGGGASYGGRGIYGPPAAYGGGAF